MGRIDSSFSQDFFKLLSIIIVPDTADETGFLSPQGTEISPIHGRASPAFQLVSDTVLLILCQLPIVWDYNIIGRLPYTDYCHRLFLLHDLDQPAGSETVCPQ